MIGEAAVLVAVAANLVTIGGVLASLRRVWRKIRAVGEGQQCLLRTRITEMYYHHEDEPTPALREYERKNLDDLYEGYKALGGNHYVDDLYRKMRDWRVVT